MRAMARCDAAPLIERALGRAGWQLDAEAIACPVRIAWGTEDRLLPWPSAAARLRTEWLPQARRRIIENAYFGGLSSVHISRTLGLPSAGLAV